MEEALCSPARELEIRQHVAPCIRIRDLGKKLKLRFKYVDIENKYAWAIDTERTTSTMLVAMVRARSFRQRMNNCDACLSKHSRRSLHCSAATKCNFLEELCDKVPPGGISLVSMDESRTLYPHVWSITSRENFNRKSSVFIVVCNRV
jgi:hypothetical protein